VPARSAHAEQDDVGKPVTLYRRGERQQTIERVRHDEGEVSQPSRFRIFW